MALSLQNIYDRIQPFLLRKLTQEQVEWIFNSDFIELANSVQEDVNIEAYANLERYYQKSDGTAQFELSGEVIEMLDFKYYDQRINSTQKWCLVLTTVAGTETTIVFKTAPSYGLQLDVKYLRKAGKLETVSDEIDLPSHLEQDFTQLLRTKILTVYGDVHPQEYENDLRSRFIKMKTRVREKFLSGAKSSMCGFVSDDFDYDILENEVGQENVVADVDGVYSWVGPE